jgi:FKBP-type peptidyl-prolyl cis-trans isomerase SlyD
MIGASMRFGRILNNTWEKKMIKSGSKVKIHYTLKVNGEVLHSSVGDEPLTYVQGSSQIIPGLEEQLEGLSVGETKKLKVPPEKAYGPWRPQAVRRVSKATFVDPENVKVGEMVSGESDGKKFHATIAEVGTKEVTLDTNHPLAGRTLDFEVRVLEVE